MIPALLHAQSRFLSIFDPFGSLHYRPCIVIGPIVRTSRESFSVGDYAVLTRTFTKFELALFCWLSGDWNRPHWDEGYAKKSQFKSVIAHGSFAGSMASALFGTKFPGEGTIYLSQSYDFKAPIRPGVPVTFRAEITELNGSKRNIATLRCIWSIEEKVVIEGQAVVRLP